MGRPHSHGSEGRTGTRSSVSLWWAMILILPRARNSFLEQLVGGSRVYVSRAILIKGEPTKSNSTSLQVSN